MASELGLARFQNLNQIISQTQLFFALELMWNMSQDNDDSWEVRAFEEDTKGNLLGCTWPPRSYMCTFCRREFRSAQALGGHMNVHRRDRARLHEVPPLPPSTSVAQPPPPLFIPTGQEFVVLFPLPNPKPILIPSMDFSSTLSPFANNDTAANSVVSSVCRTSNTEPSPSNSNDYNHRGNHENAIEEELDLELRLGRRPPRPAEK